MHKDRKLKTIGTGGSGMVGKAAVFGALERHGPDGHSRVRVHTIADNRRGTIEGAVRGSIEAGAELMTDGLGSYRFLGGEYVHNVVEHDANEYVRGTIHTNGIENFWSLLKRSIRGTYVSVERSICSAISMSRHSDSTAETSAMGLDSARCCAPSSASA